MTQSRLLLELNQLNEVTSHVGITSHSGGGVRDCLALRTAAPLASDRNGRREKISDIDGMVGRGSYDDLGQQAD